jgi:uncharacterized protein (UPF0261 family)
MPIHHIPVASSIGVPKGRFLARSSSQWPANVGFESEWRPRVAKNWPGLARKRVVERTSSAAPKKEESADARPFIAASTFQVTTPCVTEARRILEEAGFEVVVFHATGTGGQAMEGLIEDGYFVGVLDITTTEISDECVGGILSAGEGRLKAAGANGLPQVVSVGAVDMVNFGPPETIPDRFSQRLFYQHNPAVTLMRTTPAEAREIGLRIAERLNFARGPVKLLLPLDGISLIDIKGEPFHDPEADRALFDAIRENISEDIELNELNTNINELAFAQACAKALLDMLSKN